MAEQLSYYMERCQTDPEFRKKYIKKIRKYQNTSEKYQTYAKSPEKREYNRIYLKKWRERQKLIKLAVEEARKDV
jgi:hypothetical protein